MKNVVISTYTFAFDAYIIKGRLESEGIPAYVHDDQYITIDWMMSQAIGGVKVSVPESYQSQAAVVLQSTQDDHYALDPPSNDELSAELLEDYIPEQPLHCPACQSDKISKLEWSRRLSILALFALHSPLTFSQRHYSCDNCNKVFAPDPGIFSRFTLTVLTVASVLLLLLIMFSQQ